MSLTKGTVHAALQKLNAVYEFKVSGGTQLLFSCGYPDIFTAAECYRCVTMPASARKNKKIPDGRHGKNRSGYT